MTADRVLSCLRKMFNMAEVWGFRDDGTNPCRHIPKYPESGKTRLITDDEMVRLFGYLKQADEEGLEHPFLTLGVRLQLGGIVLRPASGRLALRCAFYFQPGATDVAEYLF